MKKSTNGNITKEFSVKKLLDLHNQEIKRYVGVLSEEFQGRVSGVAEQFLSISVDVKETLALVGSQEKILNLHTMMLDAQASKMKAHTEMIGKIMVQLQEIQSDMKQKVDLQQFARLEKRVVMLEVKARR